jgi:hypothetical protein
MRPFEAVERERLTSGMFAPAGGINTRIPARLFTYHLVPTQVLIPQDVGGSYSAAAFTSRSRRNSALIPIGGTGNVHAGEAPMEGLVNRCSRREVRVRDVGAWRPPDVPADGSMPVRLQRPR